MQCFLNNLMPSHKDCTFSNLSHCHPGLDPGSGLKKAGGRRLQVGGRKEQRNSSNLQLIFQLQLFLCLQVGTDNLQLIFTAFSGFLVLSVERFLMRDPVQEHHGMTK